MNKSNIGIDHKSSCTSSPKIFGGWGANARVREKSKTLFALLPTCVVGYQTIVEQYRVNRVKPANETTKRREIMKRYTLRALIHDAKIFNQLRLEYRQTKKDRRRESSSDWLSRYLVGARRHVRA
jgi:hypothetical protein